jgi:hypothetical protein
LIIIYATSTPRHVVVLSVFHHIIIVVVLKERVR